MDSLSPKQVKDIKNLYESIYKVDEVEERDYISELFESEEFDSLSDELKENMIKKLQDKLAGSEKAGVLGQIERLRRKAFGSKKESDQAREYEKNINKKNKEDLLKKKENNNVNKINTNTNKIDTNTNKIDTNKIDTSKEIESDANYAKSNAKFNQRFKDANTDTSKEIEDSRKEFDANDGKKFNQRFKDANTDTSKEIESDANYAKSNLRFNRASKGLPPVKRPRVPSPMDMLNPGGVRVKARFKAREAQGLSGLTGKPKFEAYDVVLDYVLSEGHADTLDEAHYVMMQMDENTIQQIIEMSSPYTISQADVNARTPAFKNYQKGVKNKITGEPLYKLGSGVNLPKI